VEKTKKKGKLTVLVILAAVALILLFPRPFRGLVPDFGRAESCSILDMSDMYQVDQKVGDLQGEELRQLLEQIEGGLFVRKVKLSPVTYGQAYYLTLTGSEMEHGGARIEVAEGWEVRVGVDGTDRYYFGYTKPIIPAIQAMVDPE